MPEPCREEGLARMRTAVVVLRLFIDRQGQLSHGEIVDASGEVRSRFSGWTALVPALREVVEPEPRNR